MVMYIFLCRCAKQSPSRWLAFGGEPRYRDPDVHVSRIVQSVQGFCGTEKRRGACGPFR